MRSTRVRSLVIVETCAAAAAETTPVWASARGKNVTFGS